MRMIEAVGLTKYYGRLAAIEDVSFSASAGEVIGFLGPNAAGKTTTMRILTGFSPPTRGRAVIAGFDITRDPIEVKRRVGYLPESVPLYGEMLVGSFLAYVADIKGVPRRERNAEVGRVMDRCGLGQMAKRIVGNLSKGYRQRVGLAQALIGNPPVMVLDEPTVGLDPQQIIEIRQLIKDLGREHTVLLSTHILPEVTMVCERVLIINKGRIVAQDSMANLAGAAGFLEIEAEGPEAAVIATLKKVARADKVVRNRDAYVIETDSADVVAADAAQALVQSGLKLHGLVKRSRTLEDVFLSAIASEEGAGR
jgi:ABC-2 type transport system ATP-binding protein